MAKQTQPHKEDCIVHRMEIDRLKNHDDLFKKQLADLSMDLIDIKLTLSSFNEMKKDVKDLVELRQKSTAYSEMMKYIVVLIIGMFVTYYVQNLILAVREDRNYKIEKKEGR